MLHAPDPAGAKAEPLAVSDRDKSAPEREAFTVLIVELAIRLGALALLVYLAISLVAPFASIAMWSVVIAVAIYPGYARLTRWLGGRRRLAAVLMTFLCLVLVIGPVTWLGLNLIDSLRTVSEQLEISTLTVPPPWESVKDWPVVGQPLYQFWDLAAHNLREALAQIAPQLKPVGSKLISVAADTGTGMLKFFVSIIVAGFLLPPGPALAQGCKKFAHQLASDRGEAFVDLAGATIRTVSRGVIGVSVLQAFLAALGLMAAGVPGASLLTSGVLILGIIQIGPTIILLPVVIWSWFTMEPVSALLFSAYMIPVNLIDNVLRPVLMGRGLKTPMVVILIGVLGGTIAYGITGLFLGPIVLAVIWELLPAWIAERRGET